ncbi:beta-ketoacyl synthase N-terminal-like domain-containing protein, partial [Paenibacillus sp. GbtcB18]|uniref:beta-ketoacyl synthase N-terminal-like domain-containing protein n=1 Tax=Paenibacillus sp. GbtcB18 TaxID=2824763 RepID=UPI0020C6608A
MITDQAELLYRKIKENNMSLEEYIQSMKDLKEQNKARESIIFERTLHDLTAWVSDILKVEQKDIDVFIEISDYSFDQILITEFVNKLNQEYMLDLNSKIMFEQKNIHDLAAYLIQQHTETLAELYGVKTFANQIKEENKLDIGEEVIREKVTGYLKKRLSSVIKIPETQIEEDAFFEEYGIDSIMVMQLTGELEKEFGSLPKTLFFEYQNLHTLAGYFIEKYQEQLPKILGIEEKNRQGMDKPVKPVPRRNRLIQKQRDGRNPRNGSALPVQEARSENEGMDIAVIGVAGRYPQARTLEEFWQNLKSGEDCITEIPQERWDHRLYYDEDKNKIGKTYSKWGGFIEGVDQFDPLFFHITPREAEIMDPQERLFLQCVYEA